MLAVLLELCEKVLDKLKGMMDEEFATMDFLRQSDVEKSESRARLSGCALLF